MITVADGLLTHRDVVPMVHLLRGVVLQALEDAAAEGADLEISLATDSEAEQMRADAERFIAQCQRAFWQAGDPTEAVIWVIQQRSSQAEPLPLSPDGPGSSDEPERTKVCPRCSKERPLSQYGFNRQAKDGIDYWCRECRRANYTRTSRPGRMARRAETRKAAA